MKGYKDFESLSMWFCVFRFVTLDHECVLSDYVVWGGEACEDGNSKKNQAHSLFLEMHMFFLLLLQLRLAEYNLL
jgi:hypothetical protein